MIPFLYEGLKQGYSFTIEMVVIPAHKMNVAKGLTLEIPIDYAWQLIIFRSDESIARNDTYDTLEAAYEDIRNMMLDEMDR